MMIDRHSVIEYLNKHPSHTNWQMRLHFLQATRQLDSHSSVSIGTIANQLNYILRDLEVTGKIAPRESAGSLANESYQHD
jgi:hypothetical protein